jgi:uncharacterized RmlC-like cupin family protein
MSDDVSVRKVGELTEAHGTPGIKRMTAFEGHDHWVGHAEAAANTMSGWHHHGENTTVGYILKGRIRLEFGPGGRESAEVGPGEYFTVPPGAIHREGNSTDEPAEAIVVRFGEGPPVFPADGPEPN